MTVISRSVVLPAVLLCSSVTKLPPTNVFGSLFGWVMKLLT